MFRTFNHIELIINKISLQSHAVFSRIFVAGQYQPSHHATTSPPPIVWMILGCLLTACSAQKRVWYVQDTENFTPEAVAEAGQIRIKPLDRLTMS